MSFDLENLPKPGAIEELDSQAMIAAMQAGMATRIPALAGVVTLKSEPANALIHEYAHREMLVRARVNDAVRANLLYFATGVDLDYLADFYDVARLTDEPDERLRLRVILAIQGRSTGGTAPRYRGVALAVSLRVHDAIVYRTGARPTVNVAIIASDNGGVPDAPLLASVEAALNAAAVRMVSDTIVVRSAVFSTVNVAADVWLLPETPDNQLAQLQTTLRDAWALEGGLGFNMTRAWLTARLMRPGIQRVAITAPNADVVAPAEGAIALGSITLTNRGRDR